MKTLDDLFREVESEPPPPEDPAAIERNRRKAEAERQRHIAAGWYDEDGNPGPNAEPEEFDEDDE